MLWFLAPEIVIMGERNYIAGKDLGTSVQSQTKQPGSQLRQGGVVGGGLENGTGQ